MSNFNKDELISLLNSYLGILPPRWAALQSNINTFITLISALIVLTIAGVKDLYSFPLNLFLEMGPILILLLAFYAKKIIYKQNSHIKELIVFIAKLEYQLGLYDLSQESQELVFNKPWTEDKSFLPPKWVELRLKSGSKSTEFIESFQDSTALIYFKVFSAFQVIAVVLFVFILCLPIIKTPFKINYEATNTNSQSYPKLDNK